MAAIIVEFTLNKKYTYNEDGEIIGEDNFVVPSNWLYETFKNEYLKDKYETFGNFLDCYIPEEDGEFIYNKAVKDNVLITK